MSRVRSFGLPVFAALGLVALVAWQLLPAGQQNPPPPANPPINNDPAAGMAKMKAAKADIAKKHMDMLAARYDLADKAGDAKMTRGKSVQAGPRAKLPEGKSWGDLAGMKPDDIKNQGLFPAGFMPLPH